MFEYATAADVEARWRPLSSTERTLAEMLCADASDKIRSRWADIDSRISSGAPTALTVRRVVAGMVKRAMMNPVEGVTQQSQAAGPFNLAQTFANPGGNLYFSADDIAELEGQGFGKRAAVGWLA